jgi:hypothetical protein
LACGITVREATAERIEVPPATASSVSQLAGDDATQALADKHVPVVYLKEQEQACDHKGEAYYPVAVEVVLGSETTSFYDNDALVKTAPTGADLYEKGEDFYLDLPGEPKNPKCVYDSDFVGITPAPEAVVYAHIFTEDGYDALVMQYWLYFYFNDWNNNHESDWEFIQLVFDGADDAEEALASGPTRVIYSQHGGGEQSDWGSSKVRKEGDRPVAYIAKGSHAIQYAAEKFLGKGENGTGYGCDDGSGPSYRKDPVARVIPGEIDGPENDFAWITYEGRWGQRQSGEFNGPTGPNTKKPWTEPISWMEEQRTSSVEVPQDSLGPNAANAFCGIVALGSQILFAGGPYVVLALLLGLGGAGALTSRNTWFRPVYAQPIARRRRFGQILRASWKIEREHWRLFFGIGALFVPIGLVTAGIQAVIFTITPAERVFEGIDERTIDALAVLAIGALQFGLTYWLVLNASIAAIGELAAGRRVSIPGAYRLLLRRFKDLFQARVGTVIIITLLIVSIIGIPFALYYGVRWAFIEQAVQLEGAKPRDARRRSAEIVGRQWGRTALSASTIVAFGILVGPVVGMLLVLLTSAALGFVNLISSVFYLVLIPFAAIGLTLLYYDLRLTQEGVPEPLQSEGAPD